MGYRIKEYANQFIIEKKVKETRGMWWWRREYKIWRNLTFSGEPLYCYSTGPEGRIHSNYNEIGIYTSYKNAKKMVKKFKRGIILHKI